jgi:hypothetical protein
MFQSWNWRWFAAHDTYISYHASQHVVWPLGVIVIDPGLKIWSAGRYLYIRTNTRHLVTFAPTLRVAQEWERSLNEFYNTSGRCIQNNPFGSSYPPRPAVHQVTAYCITHDYFSSLAHALLSACYDIFIMAKSHHPHVLLSRPPLPALRLDQIIKFKAEQGVQVFILLQSKVMMCYLLSDVLCTKGIATGSSKRHILPGILQLSGTRCELCGISRSEAGKA